jgi:hypothetical protein
MKLYKYTLSALTGIILLLIIGCAPARYTVELIDSDSQQSVQDISIIVFDDDGEDPLLSGDSGTDGKFPIELKTIIGDSFKIEIKGDDYFKKNVWINKPDKSTEKQFVLEKRLTIITGWVLDDSLYTGIPNSKITTTPITAKGVTTDEEGKFVLKSDAFAPGIEYTIFATNAPKYTEKTTLIRPNINKKNELELAIFLELVVQDTLGRLKVENTRVIDDPSKISN